MTTSTTHRRIAACCTGCLLALAALSRAEEPRGLHRIVPASPDALRQLLRYDGRPLPLVSAHRGGEDAGYPENCLATFERTIGRGFAMLEIDPRYSSDGQVVVHHDATLERTTTGTGRVADHTLADLKGLRLKDLNGRVTEFAMPTLQEAIEWARGKTVLVLDQKDVPTLERARIVSELRAEAFVLLIVSNFQDVRACHAQYPEIVMEVMIPDRDKVLAFDELRVPWSHVIPFVGHVPPEDRELYAEIHARGARCMIGTSRNLDRRILTGETADIATLQPEYREFLSRGADIIETDVPTRLWPLLYQNLPIPEPLRDSLRVE